MSLTAGVFPVINIVFPGSITSPAHTKLALVGRRSSSRPARPVISSVATSDEPKRSSHEPRAADRFRLGGFTEDALSYKEKFIVRSYEVGMNRTVTMQVIANFLQDAACNHFLSGYTIDDGFSTTPAMQKLNLILVLSRMHIEVYKYPTWNDVVEIETWFQIEGKIGFRRDWILRDYSTGKIIGRATGKWLLINQETRRFHQVVDEVRDELQKHCPKSKRLAFPDENKAWLKKIEKLDDNAQYSKLGLEPTRSDLDMNRHVNNVTYIGWVLESVPPEIFFNYELHSLTMDYKRECQYDVVIDSLTSPELVMTNEEGGSNHDGSINGILQFQHLLRLSGDGAETTRGRTIWKKKSSN